MKEMLVATRCVFFVVARRLVVLEFDGFGALQKIKAIRSLIKEHKNKLYIPLVSH